MRFLGKNPIFRSDRVFLTLFISREKKNRIRLFSWAFWHFFEKWPFFLPPFLRFLTFFSKIRAKKRPFWGALKNREKSAKIWCFFRTVLPLGKPLFLGGSAVPTFQKNGCFWPPPPIFQSSRVFTDRFWPFFAFFHFFLGGLPGGHFSQKKPEKKGVFGGVQNTPLFGGGGGGVPGKSPLWKPNFAVRAKKGVSALKRAKMGVFGPDQVRKRPFLALFGVFPLPPPSPPPFWPFFDLFFSPEPFLTFPALKRRTPPPWSL